MACPVHNPRGSQGHWTGEGDYQRYVAPMRGYAIIEPSSSGRMLKVTAWRQVNEGGYHDRIGSEAVERGVTEAGIKADRLKLRRWAESVIDDATQSKRNPLFLPKSLFDSYTVKSSGGEVTVEKIQTVAGAERKVRELARKYPCVGWEIRSRKFGTVIKVYEPAMKGSSPPKVVTDNSRSYKQEASEATHDAVKFQLLVDGKEYATYDTRKEAEKAGKDEGGRWRVKEVRANPESSAYRAGTKFGNKLASSSGVYDPARLIHSASADYLRKTGGTLAQKLERQREFKSAASLAFEGVKEVRGNPNWSFLGLFSTPPEPNARHFIDDGDTYVELTTPQYYDVRVRSNVTYEDKGGTRGYYVPHGYESAHAAKLKIEKAMHFNSDWDVIVKEHPAKKEEKLVKRQFENPLTGTPSHDIPELRRSGRSQRQSVAIAMSERRRLQGNPTPLWEVQAKVRGAWEDKGDVRAATKHQAMEIAQSHYGRDVRVFATDRTSNPAPKLDYVVTYFYANGTRNREYFTRKVDAEKTLRKYYRNHKGGHGEITTEPHLTPSQRQFGVRENRENPSIDYSPNQLEIMLGTYGIRRDTDGHFPDFHSLQSFQVTGLLARDEFKSYRVPRSASGSRGRYLYEHIVKKIERGNRRNPDNSDDAEALYESFHGVEPTGEIVYEERHEVPDTFTELGDLVELCVATVHSKDATIEAPDPEDGNLQTVVKLASSPDGKQLYLLGGDQSIDLDKLGFAESEERHHMLIGTIYQLTYRARKKFHKLKLTDYFHNLGEESGLQPALTYDPYTERMGITGGNYVVKPEGLVD